MQLLRLDHYYRKWYNYRMIVILHLIIAFTSIILTTFALIKPSKLILRFSLSFIGLTLASGIYLVSIAPAHMLQACVAGVVYLAVTSVGIIFANIKYAKLSKQSIDISR